jgi:hypothetical protein
LYNGQKSDIFQPAKDFGSSGTIYLQPKKPVFKDSRTTNLTVRTKSGSIQTFNPSFRLEQKAFLILFLHPLAENIWILTEFINSDITGNILMVRLPMTP